MPGEYGLIRHNLEQPIGERIALCCRRRQRNALIMTETDLTPRLSHTENLYSRWVLEHDTLSQEDRRLIRTHINLMPRHPVLSIVMPAFNTPPALLQDAIASVQAQIYPYWELCVADDASPTDDVANILRQAAENDARIRWVRRLKNGHISAATNTALTLASGEFIVLMDHDDLLPVHALYEVASELLAHPDADVIYSDEDRVDGEGHRSDPYFKPMWSPELLAGHNMISHLGAYRRTLLEEVGGLREGLEGSQDWDLALRVTARTTPDRIRHIPAVLYHWRWKTGVSSFSEAWLTRCIAAGRQALEDWLTSQNADGAHIEPARLAPTWNRVVYALPDPRPLVSVIVPTKDCGLLLERICDDVLHGTNWQEQRLELVVVDNGSTEAEALKVLDRLRTNPRALVLRFEEAFNYSKMNNLGVAQSRGDVLALLNNDIEVIQPDWLEEMVRLALRRGVGIVGAKLLYPDRRVQHGGVAMGPGGMIAHLLNDASEDDLGYMGQLALTRALSVVTGACMVMRREVYEELGGLDEAFAVTFNDADLCLRARDLGYRVVWTPDAVLLHRESATRGADWLQRNGSYAHEEWVNMRRRWGQVMDTDPFHNPNVILHGEAGGPLIPAPPRRVAPWRRAPIVTTSHAGL